MQGETQEGRSAPPDDVSSESHGLLALSRLPMAGLEEVDTLAMELMSSRLFGAQSAPPRVGRFTVIDRLGEGGMGVVYSAYDELLDRKVALKLLHPAGLAGGGDERLLREAQAMARLTHPNIVAVYEVGSFGAQLFIAMEFVRGQSLDQWLQAERRDWRVVLPMLIAAGRGLAAAHRAGIVHRDYKPHNTLVGVDGSIKVADFGLARTHRGPEYELPTGGAEGGRSTPELRLTRVGAMLGTPAYMAPEQYAGRPCDARSDQFSFCVTAYQALYGSLPFPVGSLAELSEAVTEGRWLPAPPGSLVPVWLRRTILSGLAPDPAQRHASMEALLEALARDPAVTRRRRIRTGLFGAGLGLCGLLGGTMFGPSAALACPDGVAELRGVWDDERRQALAAAMHGTGLPYAAATWEHLEQDLTKYADAWVASHGQACEAHRAGRQSDTQYDLRMRCLDQRRTSLAALTEVLARVDAAALQRAALAAAALPSVAPCSDLEALLADPLRPADHPETAPAVARVQVGLARVRALEAMGALASAVTTADELAADVAATRHVPFAAEVALYRGRALLSDRPEAADEALSTAFREGLRSGHDRVAMEALARRIFVRGYHFGRREDAVRDEELVLALLDRVDDDGRLRGEYLNNMGAVSLGQREWATAEALFVAAIRAKTSAFGIDSGELVYTYANLGTLRLDIDRSGGAIEALQAAIDIGTRALGISHPTVLRVRANLGMALIKHLRFADAEATLLAVREAAATAPDPDAMALAFVEQQLAWLAVERRRPAAAREHLRAAQGLLKDAGGAGTVTNVEVLLARCAALEGDGPRAREHLGRARAALPVDHPGQRDLDNDLAGIEATVGEHAGALALALATVQLLAADGPRSALPRARAHEHAARAQHALGRFDDARASAEAALHELEVLVAEENPRVAVALVLLAVAEAATGHPQQALVHLDRAEQIHVRCGDPDQPPLAALRFERARLLADTRPHDATELARAAALVLRAAGDGFRREAATVDAWLAQR